MSLPRSGAALLLASLLCSLPLSASPAARDRVLGGTLESAAEVAAAGPEGALVELAGGARLRLSPGARIVHERSIKLKLGPRGTDDRVTRVVRVVSGSVEVELPAEGAPPAVMLHGPSRLSAVVKEGAGTFLVGADSTTAAARRGEQLVGLGNDWKPLREGLARTLSPRDPAATPRAILAAPAPALESELLLASGDATPSAVVRWTPLAGAVTHRLRVERTSPPAQVVVDADVEGTTATTPPLTPGSYTVSVVAGDETGLAGPGSAPLPLQVVGLALPAGAEFEGDRTVLLGRGQRVRVLGAEGLEVAYGGSPEFASAPGSLGLARGGPTVVRLRAAGGQTELRVALEPKTLRADVALGPRRATWPADRVTLEIALRDPRRGRPLPEALPVDTRVTVNLEPVKLELHREGARLRATVPLPATGGPWVVRAEVLDSTGEVLGRDVLDVTPSTGPGGRLAAR